MTSVLPTFPSDLSVGSVFPFPEGQQWEFKQSACGAEVKLRNTVCGFLNSAGGYLVVGISDSGVIHGIDRKDADSILLKADSITHCIQIINTSTGGAPLPTEIHGRLIKLQNTKSNELFLGVITVCSKDKSCVFKLKECGTIVYRLSASNVQAPSYIFGSHDDMKHLRSENDRLRTEIAALRKENAKQRAAADDVRKEMHNLRRENDHLRIEVGILRKDNDNIRAEADGIRTSNARTQEGQVTLVREMRKCTEQQLHFQNSVESLIRELHARILAEKAEAEKRLGVGKWFCGLF